jgi:inhibitor of cysteine peptidase
MHYDQQSNGKVISPRVDDEFQIVLPETRTAGYRWTIAQSGDPHCKLLDERSDPTPGTIGGSGSHTWRFKAASSGTGKIQLHYGRAWKNTAAPEQTFTMEVQVRP